MKELKKELQVVKKDLNALNRRIEKIAAKLDKLENAAKAKPAAKTKAKPTAKAKPAKKTTAAKKAVAQKPARVSGSDTVLKIITRRKKGIDMATLKKLTGFKDDNMRMIVYRLKKRGAIKSPSKGVYVKA